MNTQPNFEELLRLFEENRVEYMIVGGYAVAFHGYPRFTKDIDLFFRNSSGNIARLRNALLSFGFSEEDIPESLFATLGNIVQIGIIPVRVDLMNEIDGVSFADAWENINRGPYGRIEVNFIGRYDLLKNKKASGRPQDSVDAQLLEQGIV